MGRRKIGIAASVAAFSLAASASPAGAAVTIGQLAPGSPPPALCNNGVANDWVQPTVTSGNSYVVPTTGGIASWTLTSWSHNAAAGAGQQLIMKVYRKVGEPNIYQVVGHDGPRAISSATVNTFPAGIPVRAGDVLGLNDDTVDTGCAFSVPGQASLIKLGNLADGEAGAFGNEGGLRLNVTAVIDPTNSFTLGKVIRNQKKGTATLMANVPNPGTLTGSGKGVKVAGAAVISETVTAPGEVKLTIRAKGKRKAKLNDTGKVKLNAKISYTPTGGTASTQPLKVKLKLKKNV